MTPCLSLLRFTQGFNIHRMWHTKCGCPDVLGPLASGCDKDQLPQRGYASKASGVPNRASKQ